jgi:hypothetical protein
MRSRTSVLRTARLAATVVLLSGCGGGGSDFSDEPAADILKATTTDMQALDSVRMAGEIEASGRQVGFDLELTTQGDCQGTFRLENGSARIIASGGNAWMKPDHAFWAAQAGARAGQIERLVGDKWVAIPSSSGLTDVCDLDAFLDKIKDPGQDQAASVTVVGTDRVAGQHAVRVRDTGKDDDRTDGWIATDDPHYLLKLEVTGSGGGTVTFSDFDADVTVEPPAASDVADLGDQPR